MNRNAISRLVEVSLFAGIAISLVGAGSAFAQGEATVAPPAASKARQKIATQKRMRNPWEKTIEVASTQPRAGGERLRGYW